MTQIDALTDGQLAQVSGGQPLINGGDYKGCEQGMVTWYTDCSAPTNGEVYAAFFEGVRKGMGK